MEEVIELLKDIKFFLLMVQVQIMCIHLTNIFKK